jgi:hypothetical protein
LQISADGLKLTAITQDVGNAVEELDATSVGSELTVAFIPTTSRRGGGARHQQVTLSTIDGLSRRSSVASTATTTSTS